MTQSQLSARGGVLLLSAAVAAFAVAGCDSPPADANSASTGEVVLYCSVDPEFARQILATFKEQTGIRVKARFDEEASKTTGLVQRLRAEADNPTADVFWSSECFQTIDLANQGLLAPYHGPAAANWPSQFADPNGLWHAFGLRMRVIAWDTRRVKADEAPARLEDLLDAKWKDRIVMAEPTCGTTRGDVASWFAHYGADRAKEILRGLADNQVRLVQGNSTAVRMIARGEADVCLTDTDDVYVARRNGWPVEMAPLDQGGAGALAIPNTVALVNGRPANPAAGALIEFLLSEAVERLLAESESHNIPIRPDVAGDYGQYILAAPLSVDYRDVASRQNDAIAAAREILRR